MLIDEGIRNRQKEGVVYDSLGNVICFDPDRVNPDSLELLKENMSNKAISADAKSRAAE